MYSLCAILVFVTENKMLTFKKKLSKLLDCDFSSRTFADT